MRTAFIPARATVAALLIAASASGDEPRPSVGNWPSEHAACRPVSLRSVRLAGFLGQHVDANNRRSLLAGLESPIPRAFEARAAGREPPPECRRLAADSDFYKWLEGACYALTYEKGLTDLRAAVDRYAAMLVKLQEPDGYLGTRVNPAQPFDERVAHDLYIAGHFFEAAVAHHQATGGSTLLDVARRLADFYIRAHAEQHPYFRVLPREHPEIEPALVRLYRATGDAPYLAFAGDIARASHVGPMVAELHAGGGKRHAVRTAYLLTGYAELFLQTGDRDWLRYLPDLWTEIVDTRMYVTGGIGYNETIPAEPYDLPQTLTGNLNRDIAETCASVAMMMWSWRMHAIDAGARRFDVIETILYNHYLGAVSQDHLGVFYYNPLRRTGDLSGRTDHGADPMRRRRLPEIHSTACCLPNAWRFFAQLPEYVFSTRGDDVLVNLYTDAEATHRLGDDTQVRLRMQTRYPHDGHVRLQVKPERTARFAICPRIPAWCTAARVRIGEGENAASAGEYLRIERQWSEAGEEVVLELPMAPEVIRPHPQVEANRGQVAFRRGPLVYCLEKQDAEGIDPGLVEVMLDSERPERDVRSEFSRELGMHLLRVPARLAAPGTQPAPAPQQIDEVTLVPFYFRANRAEDTRWVTWISQQQER